MNDEINVIESLLKELSDSVIDEMRPVWGNTNANVIQRKRDVARLALSSLSAETAARLASEKTCNDRNHIDLDRFIQRIGLGQSVIDTAGYGQDVAFLAIYITGLESKISNQMLQAEIAKAGAIDAATVVFLNFSEPTEDDWRFPHMECSESACKTLLYFEAVERHPHMDWYRLVLPQEESGEVKG